MSHVNWNERSDSSSGRLSDIALEAIKIPRHVRLQTSYRFLNSTRTPPWILVATPSSSRISEPL